MRTIEPGMTRQALPTVFTTEGGIYQVLHWRFVSRDRAGRTAIDADAAEKAQLSKLVRFVEAAKRGD
jgi:hypothetical protein